jgi:hypothetical protein
MRHPTIIACLAPALLALAAFSGTASTGCGSNSSSGSGSSSGGVASSSSGGSGASSGTGSSGNSGGSGASSSGGSDGGTSSSGGSGSGSSSGSSSGATPDAAIQRFNDAGIPFCEPMRPCDLKSNTCCLSQTLQATCLAHPMTCPSGTASFGCLGVADCPTAGQKCCGSADSNAMVAQTACQMLGTNGLCSGKNTTTSAFAQVCRATSECGGGLRCISQSCAIGAGLPPANLSMCGLQSAAPFNCTPN